MRSFVYLKNAVRRGG